MHEHGPLLFTPSSTLRAASRAWCCLRSVDLFVLPAVCVMFHCGLYACVYWSAACVRV